MRILPRPGARAALALVLALPACTPTPPAPAEADLTAGLVARDGGTPPERDCWSPETLPAVFETVTEQVQAAGGAGGPATFRTETRQRMVSDRREVWLPVPCGPELTVEFVASLQRALKARGLYREPLTGHVDAATRAAIRAWQRPRGLDTDTLSLAAARALGLIAAGPPG